MVVGAGAETDLTCGNGGCLSVRLAEPRRQLAGLSRALLIAVRQPNLKCD